MAGESTEIINEASNRDGSRFFFAGGSDKIYLMQSVQNAT